MTTTLIRRIAAAAAVLSAGLVLAACGSDNATGPTDAQVEDAASVAKQKSGETTATQETTTATAPETTGTTTQAASADGKAIFSENCAGCHTLEAAGAEGQVGPVLDELKPSASRVETAVTNGRGAMPAFGGQLSAAEITAVAEYVSSSAG